MAFVVAAWNLQWKFGEWEARQPAIRATLADLDADVLLLQETWQTQAAQLADDLGFEFVWAGHDPHDDPERTMGNTILSRWPIQRHGHRFLEDAEGRRYRTIVGARLASPWGVLPVFTTHLEHRFDRSSTRLAQLAAASEFIEQHTDDALAPILAGDLNAVADSDEIRKLTGRSEPFVTGRIWTDAWEQVGDGPGLTWANTNQYLVDSAWPNRRLDYVLIGWPRPDRPLGNPRRAWLFGTDPVGGVTPSDHYGVAVEIHTP